MDPAHFNFSFPSPSGPSEPSLYDIALCYAADSPYSCVKDQLGRALDTWETQIEEKRHDLLGECENWLFSNSMEIARWHVRERARKSQKNSQLSHFFSCCKYDNRRVFFIKRWAVVEKSEKRFGQPHVHSTQSSKRGKNNQSSAARAVHLSSAFALVSAEIFHSILAAHPKSGFPMIVGCTTRNGMSGCVWKMKGKFSRLINAIVHDDDAAAVHMKCDRWLDFISHFSTINYGTDFGVYLQMDATNKIMFPCQLSISLLYTNNNNNCQARCSSSRNWKSITERQERDSQKSQDSLSCFFSFFLFSMLESRFLIQF